MCPITEHPDQLSLPFRKNNPLPEPSESGSTPSPGPTGGHSLSATLSALTVRLHKGLSHMSVGSLSLTHDVPGTFTALKRDDLGGYTLMLSCALTSSQYAALIAALEGPSTALGESVSVGLEFVPMTPNLAPPSTAPSTS